MFKLQGKENMGRQNRMSKCEPEAVRRQALLCQMKEGLENVTPELLLVPNSSTRPEVGLVAYCSRVRQVVFADFSLGPMLALLLPLVVSGSFWTGIWDLVPALETWINLLFSVIPWEIPRLLAIQISFGLMLGILGCCIVGIAAFLLGNVSITSDTFALDLNGLYYHSPKGRIYIPWSQVYASECNRTRWIRIFQEDGGTLVCRVPLQDRDWMAQIIRLLILHHQPGLYGKRNAGS